jgi:hypothetical protein
MYDIWAVTYTNTVYALNYKGTSNSSRVPERLDKNDDFNTVGFIAQDEKTGAVENYYFVNDHYEKEFFRQRR